MVEGKRPCWIILQGGLDGFTGRTKPIFSPRECTSHLGFSLAHKVGGRVIGPLGFGTMADGHSSLCMFLALRLLHELKQHQRILANSSAELRATFVENGMPEHAEMDFKLVRRTELDIPEDQISKMCSVEGFSRTLWLNGFAVIETYTRSLI